MNNPNPTFDFNPLNQFNNVMGGNLPTQPTSQPPLPQDNTPPQQQLQELGVNTDHLDNQVTQDIQTAKDNTRTSDQFKQVYQQALDMPISKGKNPHDVYLQVLQGYKSRGLTIQGVNIDKILQDTQLTTQPNTTQPNTTQPNTTQPTTVNGVLGKVANFLDIKPLDNAVFGAVSQVPEMVGNFASFLTKITKTQISPVGFAANTLDSILQDKFNLPPLADLFKQKGLDSKKAIQDKLGVEPDALATKLGEFSAELASLATPAGEVKAISKAGELIKGADIVKLINKSETLKGVDKLRNFLGNLVSNSLQGASFGAKTDILTKGEVTPQDVAFGAVAQNTIPIVGGLIKSTLKLGGGLTDGLINYISSKSAGLEPDVAKLITKDPILAEKIFTGKITAKELSKIVDDKLPDSKMKDEQYKKFFDRIKAITKGTVKKGETLVDSIKRLTEGKNTTLIQERLSKGNAIGEFKTDTIIGTSTDLTNLVDKVYKDMGGKVDINGKTIGLSPDELKAKDIVESVIKSIVGDNTDISAKEFLKIHNSIKSKINFEINAGESTGVRTALTRFSTPINDLIEGKLGADFIKAKKTLSNTFNEIKDFSNKLINKKTGKPKENISSILDSLMKPKNKDKLTNFAKAFGTSEEEFMKNLKELQNKNISAAFSQKVEKGTAQSLLTKIRQGDINLSSLGKKETKQIEQDLHKLIKSDKLSSLNESIFNKALGGGTDIPTIDYQALTSGQINKIRKLDTVLADKLTLKKGFVIGENKTGTSGRALPGVTANLLTKNKTYFIKKFIAYSKFKKGLSSTATKIANKLKKGEGLNPKEFDIFNGFMIKTVLMSTN